MKEKKLYEFEIKVKKTADAPTFEKIKFNQADSPEKVAELCRKCFDDGKIEWVEQVIVIALNRALNVVGFYQIASGGLTSSVCDVRVIFQFALLANASQIIVAHNHPSGSLIPSRADEQMTSKLKQAGRMMEIELLDHVIITANGHYSFAQEGTL